jgi:hypothetical protein
MAKKLLSHTFRVLLSSIAFGTLVGCIADNAEDTDLPWASNRGWEGIAPISPAVMDRYD